MGIQDRDYMRERRKGSTQWNDRKGRVEGAWFEEKNRGFDYQKARWRPIGESGRPAIRFRAAKWPLILCGVLALIPVARDMIREGYIPTFEGEDLPFPDSGSVTVANDVTASSATSSLTVEAGPAHAMVQLFEPETSRHVITLYVRKGDRKTTRVPPGTFRMRVAEGSRWFGPQRFFGRGMTYEEVADLIDFPSRGGAGIRLVRVPYGEVKTRPTWSSPPPL